MVRIKHCNHDGPHLPYRRIIAQFKPLRHVKRNNTLPNTGSAKTSQPKGRTDETHEWIPHYLPSLPLPRVRSLRRSDQPLIRPFLLFNNLAVERNPILLPLIVQHQSLRHFTADDYNVR